MAEQPISIPIRIPGLDALVGQVRQLGQTPEQLRAYEQALGRVDQRARRLFDTMRELGTRQREQGFLGAEDQRQAQRTMQQWEQASRVLDLARRGAAANVQHLQGQPWSRQQAAALGRAETLASGLNLRQRGMAGLERHPAMPLLPGLPFRG